MQKMIMHGIWEEIAESLGGALVNEPMDPTGLMNLRNTFQALTDTEKWRVYLLLIRQGVPSAVLTEHGVHMKCIHPQANRIIHRFRRENMDILKLVRQEIPLSIKSIALGDTLPHRDRARNAVTKLCVAERHYCLVEELMIPNFDPPLPMGIHLAIRAMYQDIRRMLRDMLSAIEDPDREYEELYLFVDYMVQCVREAVDREDALLPGLIEQSRTVQWDELLDQWEKSEPRTCWNQE